ncbi:Mud2p SCDLUD_004060 [Saccharomycodes ludwigii]|uniref:Mud2p n=1 Tax=Saccharomycodes ludwigii TaxID=36035 RepID=UPI001E874FE5|nr:hypothetical protein SCDLUD_004060 [Saccharomycodes ludwigii]KAH3899772.1 hypothetical protein SCDLUD_004060 [Saccharomycodes ludwigii]
MNNTNKSGKGKNRQANDDSNNNVGSMDVLETLRAQIIASMNKTNDIDNTNATSLRKNVKPTLVHTSRTDSNDKNNDRNTDIYKKRPYKDINNNIMARNGRLNGSRFDKEPVHKNERNRKVNNNIENYNNKVIQGSFVKNPSSNKNSNNTNRVDKYNHDPRGYKHQTANFNNNDNRMHSYNTPPKDDLDEIVYSQIEGWSKIQSIDELKSQLNIKSKWNIPAKGFESYNLSEIKSLGIFVTPTDIVERNFQNFNSNHTFNTNNTSINESKIGIIEQNRGRQRDDQQQKQSEPPLTNEAATNDVLQAFYKTQLDCMLIFDKDPKDTLVKFFNNVNYKFIDNSHGYNDLMPVENWEVTSIRHKNMNSAYVVLFNNAYITNIIESFDDTPFFSGFKISRPQNYKPLSNKYILATENDEQQKQQQQRRDGYDNGRNSRNSFYWKIIVTLKDDGTNTTTTRILTKMIYFHNNYNVSIKNHTSEMDKVVRKFEKSPKLLDMLKQAPPMPPSKVLSLYNCIDPVDLKKQEFYDKIRNSIMKNEMGVLNGIESCEIPRPGLDYIHTSIQTSINNGIGKIFIKFSSLEDSMASFKSLQNWKFQDRQIIPSFYPESDFNNGILL